jgi:hypothetical protein
VVFRTKNPISWSPDLLISCEAFEPAAARRRDPQIKFIPAPTAALWCRAVGLVLEGPVVRGRRLDVLARSLRLASLLPLVLLVTPLPAAAQFSSALQGTISDTQQAFVPDAIVRVTNTTTGVTREVATSAARSSCRRGGATAISSAPGSTMS